MQRLLLRVLPRAVAATFLLWLIVALPLPAIGPQLFVMLRLPLAIFCFIAYIGKLLFDTFFYDRYSQ